MNYTISQLMYFLLSFFFFECSRHENPVTWAPLEIIKNTEDLIVINKPSSIPCHPCGRYRFNSIVFILGKEMGFTNLRSVLFLLSIFYGLSAQLIQF